MNTKAFRNISYGLYVVTTLYKGRKTGCVANSVMQITATPPTLAVSLNHDNYTNPCIKESGYFAVSILSEASDPKLIGKFGFRSGKDTDKFEGVDFETAGNMPVLSDSCGYLVCKVIDKMEAETHTVFLGEIIDAELKDGKPMTYAYYHEVVKGKSPKNAPTYLPDEDPANRTKQS